MTRALTRKSTKCSTRSARFVPTRSTQPSVLPIREAPAVNLLGRRRPSGASIQRLNEELGASFLRLTRGFLRRTNMSRADAFVKRVNTTYCGFLLGQTQDVGIHRCSRKGRREADNRPPRAQAETWVGRFFLPRAREKEVALKKSKQNATRAAPNLLAFRAFRTRCRFSRQTAGISCVAGNYSPPS
jgi:hypothetical protein